MSKLWCIALALGDPADGLVVISMQMNGLQELAVAQAVSDVYRQTGTKLPLMGVNVRELTREYLETALKAMDEAEAKSPSIVQLVPKAPIPITAEEWAAFTEQRARELGTGIAGWPPRKDPPDEPAA